MNKRGIVRASREVDGKWRGEGGFDSANELVGLHLQSIQIAPIESLKHMVIPLNNCPRLIIFDRIDDDGVFGPMQRWQNKRLFEK